MSSTQIQVRKKEHSGTRLVDFRFEVLRRIQSFLDIRIRGRLLRLQIAGLTNSCITSGL